MGAFWSTTKFDFYQQHLYDFIQNDLIQNDFNDSFYKDLVISQPETKLSLNLSSTNLRYVPRIRIFNIDMLLSLDCKGYTFKYKDTMTISCYDFNDNLKASVILYKLFHNQFTVAFNPKTLNYILTITLDPENEHDTVLNMENITYVLNPTKGCLQKHIVDLKEEIRGQR